MLEKVELKDKILEGVFEELLGVLKKARVTVDPLRGLKQIEAAAEIYLMMLSFPLS